MLLGCSEAYDDYDDDGDGDGDCEDNATNTTTNMLARRNDGECGERAAARGDDSGVSDSSENCAEFLVTFCFDFLLLLLFLLLRTT